MTGQSQAGRGVLLLEVGGSRNGVVKVGQRAGRKLGAVGRFRLPRMPERPVSTVVSLAREAAAVEVGASEAKDELVLLDVEQCNPMQSSAGLVARNFCVLRDGYAAVGVRCGREVGKRQDAALKGGQAGWRHDGCEM